MSGFDYFNGRITPETEKLDNLLGRESLAIGELILTEVLQRFGQNKDFNQARELPASLTLVNLLHSDRDFGPFVKHPGLPVVTC